MEAREVIASARRNGATWHQRVARAWARGRRAAVRFGTRRCGHAHLRGKGRAARGGRRVGAPAIQKAVRAWR